MQTMATDSAATDVALSEGSEHTRDEWEKATAAVLRKGRKLADDAPDSDVWAKLTLSTLDGIAIPPLGTPALTADLASTGLPGQAPFTRGTAAARELQAWDIRSHFTDPDPKITRDHIMTDLENGVNSLWLTIGSTGIAIGDLPALLDGVFLDLAPAILDAPTDPVAAADALVAILSDRDLDAAPGTNLGADPIGASFRGNGLTDPQLVAAVAERAIAIKARAVVVDGTAVHDAGASEVQELAYSLAVGAAYLRVLVEAGHDADVAASLLEFRYAATDDQFTTIAKFRAARRLWHRVAELSGVSRAARGQLQHGVTSRPMMSVYDPYVNMLRTTVASFAAGVGGATSVTVLPFDAALGLPEAFSRRIARNTSSLLISESHVAKVTDPAGGSHTVEKLTDDLARAAWASFGAIEAAGGIATVIADGSLRASIEETVAKRVAEIGTRKRPLTGVSEFPNLHEELPVRRAYPEGSLPVARYGAPFEDLRDARMATPVFLATMGPISAHTARATFASNLLAAGGIDTVIAGATNGVDDVISAYQQGGGMPVVCLAGADKLYAEWGADLIAALRAAGATWVILAGKPGDGIVVDDSAAVGADALAFLRRTRDQLSTSTEGGTV
ncbi:MAG: methylmalonyl-CoA mutase [Nocardioidaceae bacterium]|nr:methylmalonyl-CoA mutase [Nocardioidaceae bacterium]